MEHKIGQILGLSEQCTLAKAPLYGIEMELEGRPYDACSRLRGWVVTDDGSLRNGVEYISASPTPYTQARLYTSALYKSIAQQGLRGGPRCSMHLHANWSNRTLDELLVHLTLHTLIEPL